MLLHAYLIDLHELHQVNRLYTMYNFADDQIIWLYDFL